MPHPLRRTWSSVAALSSCAYISSRASSTPLRTAKQFRPSLGGSEHPSHLARLDRLRTKVSASWVWKLFSRTCAAAGPREEIDSSSAGAIESDMDEMGAMAVVSAEIVKSMSMTTSFPPSVRRRA